MANQRCKGTDLRNNFPCYFQSWLTLSDVHKLNCSIDLEFCSNNFRSELIFAFPSSSSLKSPSTVSRFLGTKKFKDFLRPRSPDRKKLKELKVKQIDNKVREHPSMASSSNSEWPELKQTVVGIGGIGPTNIDNSNSNITFTYGKVQINNIYGETRRNDLDVSKDTRGDIFPTSKFGETTARRNMEKIWGLIIGDAKKIGVYGMGGIGKTTVMKYINNRILEEKNDKFDSVIWVTVSKKFSIFNLRRDIAREIDVNLSKCKDPTTRARKLYKALKQNGRYLLILDDLWEGYPLEDVGIPDPDDLTSSSICKLVLTTRSLEVCKSMKCEDIKMDLLSEDEAWSLFLHHVGHDVLEVKDLEPIARGVALECARLPLAIATVGRSMAGKKETFEWRDALAKLKALSKKLCDEGKIIIEQLKFSFDRLEDNKLRECLKYCALYPEDYKIKRDELVELITLEGIIEEKEFSMAEIDECNAILNKLISQCLLEGGESYSGESFVKMHDLVRDTTVQINNLHSQYLAISGIKMEKPSHVKWSGDLLKIHISDCNSLSASPVCPRLTTFILNYSSLPNLHNSFFQHFKSLKVLNLSFCWNLEVLPDSISNLVNLVGLFIRHCEELRYVPTLAMLKNLQSLEISYTSLRHIPNGLEELSNLRYLNLFSSPIEVLPPKIIPRLSNLWYLVFSFITEVSVTELMSLKNLKMLRVSFRDIHNLRAFVKHREQERSPLISYKIKVFEGNSLDLGFERDSERVFTWVSRWNSFDNVVYLKSCTLCTSSGEIDLYLLPKDVKKLVLKNIQDLTSLCPIASLNYATDLWFYTIDSCEGVRELVTTSSSSSFAPQSLQTLNLSDCENLEDLIGGKKAWCNVFPCLQELDIFNCKRIKVLFNVGLLSTPKNLEKLIVRWCLELEEIIGESMDNDRDLNEAMTCVALPKLRSLHFELLPNLKSICPPTRRLICESLKEIVIEDCPELEQCVYAALELEDDSGEPSPSPSLQPIELKLLNKSENRCLNLGSNAPPFTNPADPGTLLQFTKDLPVAQSPGPLPYLTQSEVLEPPLPGRF